MASTMLNKLTEMHGKLYFSEDTFYIYFNIFFFVEINCESSYSGLKKEVG